MANMGNQMNNSETFLFLFLQAPVWPNKLPKKVSSASLSTQIGLERRNV